mmetsp:Transcript_36050/g.53720  ORF Transcript_36050/g.53720 Transcript_36050/m.53720 type:complete len:487 (-) Transcript_36050:115-1575(-)|eukprot:CAMPEP_0194060762 /NCGR_PEP_ID=MMETSP0009_2-20130614/72666_1 /TAXON_ID=210454 /ORGANISM="Grammatophora oceanica, Strain CCMP 410" /LENGTH=486 /DNA_ID=CAMNT_0038711783 /DNA_START=214 /DNA_END=1674 /DNA_ORIENTATION=+
MAAAACATQMVRHMESYSRVICKDREQRLAKFDRDEVILGDLLGSGGFNNVFALHSLELHDFLPNESESDLDLSSDTAEEVQGEARRCLAFSVASGERYAVKFLKRETMENPELFCNGAADLVIEAKILGSINHPNIVNLYGMAAAGPSGFRSDLEGGFFLIVDQLEMTLSDKIGEWRGKANKQESRMMVSQFINRGQALQREEQRFLLERFEIALNLSDALSYLHCKHIIFRDLKPDNIGFTYEGKLKLFDFGLAKELDPREQTSRVNYKMSGQTGSRRYMAPEVVKSEPYSLKADIYSFIIVVYEIFSLQPAYKGMTVDEHFHDVVLGRNRPALDPLWPSVLSSLLKCGWAGNPMNRPTMTQIHYSLSKTLRSMKAQCGEDSSVPVAPQGRRRRHHHRMSLTGATAVPTVPAVTSGTVPGRPYFTKRRPSLGGDDGVGARSPQSGNDSLVATAAATKAACSDDSRAPLGTKQPGRRKASRRSSL